MIVVKIGGAAGIDGAALTRDVADLRARGEEIVLVHGGSDETNRLGEDLGHPPRFVTSPSGHTSRLTDRRTLEIFLMATGLVNRRLVEQLQGLGVDALGLSGVDGRVLEAKRKGAIRVVENGRQRIVRDDWTGKPTGANATLLRTLLRAGHMPVIAPVALSEAGEALNVDGDRAAATIAGALGAETLVILTNVPGLLRDPDDEGSLVSNVAHAELDGAMELAKGRMRKKVLGAREALDGGLHRVVLADARRDRPLTRALRGEGTVLEGRAHGAAS